MVAKWKLRHCSGRWFPFLATLGAFNFEVVKNYYWGQKHLSYSFSIGVSKTFFLCDDFEPTEYVAKSHLIEVISKRNIGKWTSTTCLSKFLICKFFGEHDASFSTGIKSASNSGFPIKMTLSILFGNFEPKCAHNGSKKKKALFKSVLNWNLSFFVSVFYIFCNRG